MASPLPKTTHETLGAVYWPCYVFVVGMLPLRTYPWRGRKDRTHRAPNRGKSSWKPQKARILGNIFLHPFKLFLEFVFEPLSILKRESLEDNRKLSLSRILGIRDSDRALAQDPRGQGLLWWLSRACHYFTRTGENSGPWKSC